MGNDPRSPHPCHLDPDFASFGFHHHVVRANIREHSSQTPRAVHGCVQPQIHLLALALGNLFGLEENPVETWRGDLQRVSVRHASDSVKQRAYLIADRFAVIDGYAFRAVDVDAKPAAPSGRMKLDSPYVESESLDTRLQQALQLVRSGSEHHESKVCPAEEACAFRQVQLWSCGKSAPANGVVVPNRPCATSSSQTHRPELTVRPSRHCTNDQRIESATTRHRSAACASAPRAGSLSGDDFYIGRSSISPNPALKPVSVARYFLATRELAQSIRILSNYLSRTKA